MRKVALLILAVVAAFILMPAQTALAQQCVGLANAPTAPGRQLVQPVGFKLAPFELAQARVVPSKQGPVTFTFIGHASFLIESPDGVKIITDYNDYVRSPVVPDIITMNISHDSHWSRAPDPRIKHVLPGWNPTGRGPVEHDIKVGDVQVRNIPTNTRDWGGGTREFGNSVFVFEIAGLCIAHLGHLHHELTHQQVGLIGQMDILLVPVDGGYTLDLEGMAEVLKGLKARVMIPMHFFSSYGLERFLRRVRQDFEIVENAVPTVRFSRTSLPEKQQVVVLPGR